MSKVAEVLQRSINSDICLIIYDEYSSDSILGAGILKYICENITDAAETAECIKLTDTIDPEKQYKSISYVGCIPNDNIIKELSKDFGDLLLFVLCDKNQYDIVKSNSSKASIEYSKNDSCSLNLYKIAFGEFEDIIPSIIKVISNGVMNKFDNTYNDYLAFDAGLIKKYDSFDSLFENIIEPLCLNVANDSNDLSDLIDEIKSNGQDILNADLVSIARGKKYILSDKFTVGNIFKNSYMIFSNAPITENIKNELPEAEIIINVFRKSINEVAIELIKNVDELEVTYEEVVNRLNEVETDSVEYKELEAEKYSLYDKATFNCGKYLSLMYRGTGSKSHGIATILFKNFRLIVEKQKL